MTKISRAIRAFLADETGATAIEYALMVALIAAVIVVAVTAIGSQLKSTFEYILGCLTGTACAPKA